MSIYPSCLSNRIDEARKHLNSIKKHHPSPPYRYPYYLIDFAVRMRPIVEAIDEARNADIEIKLFHFEKSRLYRKNDRYSEKNEVALGVMLGAIIHEKYIHIGQQEADEETTRLDVKSDRGRWIVDFSEFIDKLESYILPWDEIATVVCDIVDNQIASVKKAPEKYKTIAPEMGNRDLDWLLHNYAVHELSLKKSIMSEIFKMDDVLEENIKALRFSANSIGYQNFDLYFTPTDWVGNNSMPPKKISWTIFMDIFRRYLRTK